MLFQSRKLVKVIASLFCFLCILPAFSQEDSDWYWDKPISQIAFEGLKSIKKSELTGITNNFIGKPFTEEVYNDLLDRLYSLAYFEEVEPFAKHDQKNPGKVLLVFQVKEHPVISEIVFKRNKKIRNNKT